jgi:hypothetical protein
MKDKNLTFDGAFMTNLAITGRKIVSSPLLVAFWDTTPQDFLLWGI